MGFSFLQKNILQLEIDHASTLKRNKVIKKKENHLFFDFTRTFRGKGFATLNHQLRATSSHPTFAIIPIFIDSKKANKEKPTFNSDLPALRTNKRNNTMKHVFLMTSSHCTAVILRKSKLLSK